MATIHDSKSEHEHEAEHAEAHHGGSFKTYWIIAGVLALATLVEVWLSEYMSGAGITGGPVVGSMMGIAIFKAVLVAAFYMHLKYEKKLLWWTMIIPLLLALLLMAALFTSPTT